jgi:hypothetical protein
MNSSQQYSVFLEEISCVVLQTTRPTLARRLLLLVKEKRIKPLTGGGHCHGQATYTAMSQTTVNIAAALLGLFQLVSREEADFVGR